MWFSHAKQEENPDRPNLEQLNDGGLECPECHSVFGLPPPKPLSIEKCAKCEAPIFIPYLVHRYWLYRPLGGGGMGCVYKAIPADADNDKNEYAVKLLPRERQQDPYLIESLLKEAAIGKSFGEHPHLTPVDEFGECDGEYFSAMKYVEGQRLDQIIESSTNVSAKYVLLWALQILSAEQRIYDCGYLYRDLKPQNIIVDSDGNIHLIDYGLCIPVEEAIQQSVADSVEGSPLYMPPERIVGAGEGMPSEIYSLGMVMFHTLAKQTYYSASGVFELARKHVSSIRFTSVGTRLSVSVSPKVCTLIDKMIARLPSDRFLSFREAGGEIKKLFNELKD